MSNNEVHVRKRHCLFIYDDFATFIHRRHCPSSYLALTGAVGDGFSRIYLEQMSKR